MSGAGAEESAPVDLDVRCLSGEGCKVRVRPILLGRELLGTRNPLIFHGPVR